MPHLRLRLRLIITPTPEMVEVPGQISVYIQRKHGIHAPFETHLEPGNRNAN